MHTGVGVVDILLAQLAVLCSVKGKYVLSSEHSVLQIWRVNGGDSGSFSSTTTRYIPHPNNPVRKD